MMAYKCALSSIKTNDIGSFLKNLNSQTWRELIAEFKDYQLLKKSIYYRSNSITQLLLKLSSRVYKLKCRNTPLHIAARLNQGLELLVKELLSRGARVALKTRKGETALHLAFAHRASDEMIDLLLDHNLKRRATNIKNKQGLSYLHIACARNRLDVVQKLISSAPTDVNCQVACNADSAYAGYTPLHFAVKYEQVEIAKLLLLQGANFHIGDVNGTTPLLLALECRNLEMIDLLLAFDTQQWNITNRYGLTHFMAACAGSNTSIVQQFIKTAGVSAPFMIKSQVKVDDNLLYANSGFTPLHFAAEFGRTITVHLLLGWGANCCSVAQSTPTPRVLAIENHHQEALNVIEAHCFHKMQLSSQQPEDLSSDSGFTEDCVVSSSSATIEEVSLNSGEFDIISEPSDS